ncbi:hypothetical protein ACEWY4_024694 [Coilia grayii]|uniref:Galectin n=1 Tax=Coilia grayii TaxID=363190 RepID=A0ABD1IVG4_9TELE
MPLLLTEESLKQNDKLTVRGYIHRTAERFHINLGEDDENLALHIDVRFDQGSTVLNTKKDGQWNPVEIRGENDFKQGSRFELTIKHNVDEFEVSLPQGKTMTISNRLSMGTIKMISIGGDINITDFLLLD